MKKHSGVFCKGRWKGQIFIFLRWVLLILSGWLLYCLIRALAGFISLGTPLYDWQWYVVIILFLIILIIFFSGLLRRRPGSRGTKLGLLLLSLWMVLGYFGFWQKERLLPSRADKIKISYWTGTGIIRAPDRALDDLQTTSGSLYISIGENEFNGEYTPNIVKGLRQLASHEIKVYLAPRASDYVCVPVLDEWMRNVRNTATLVQKERLKNVIGIIGDFEKPCRLPLDYWGLQQETMAPAVKKLEQFKAEMAKNHPSLDLGVTAFWTLYLDGVDGDPDLSILSRCPANFPGSWDFINIMAYSSFFPSPWRAYYMYLVERIMSQRYRNNPPSYLIGLVGSAGPGEPLMGYDDLLRDARISRALSAREVVVYRLDSALTDFGDDFVVRLDSAVNDVPPEFIVDVPFSRPVSLLVYGVLVADSFQDARGWRGLLILVWAIMSGLVIYLTPAERSGRHSPVI